MVEIPVPKEVADGEIIRSLVGSTLHGTGMPGQEDTDYMGVAVEPWQAVLGLDHFEQWSWRTQPEGVRSGVDDIDITIYGLGKYLRLAVQGNPSMLLLLFVGEEFLTVDSEWGYRLQDLSKSIISQHVTKPFLGYCKAQRERLEDVRGGRHTNRPELVSKHGYDTKYAMHALRLAYQGQEILETGRITLPMPPHFRKVCSDIRAGQVPYGDFMNILNEEEARLLKCGEKTRLPAHPDMEKINQFCRDIRMFYYA